MLLKILHRLTPLVLVLVLLPLQQAVAEISETFAEQTQQLQTLSTEMRQKVLPMLSLIKEMEKQQSAIQTELVKVHNTTAPVYEADNADALVRYTAQLNDEYPIVDQRDQWYQITLFDGRTGWIHEDEVQVITASLAAAKGGSVSLT